MRHREQHNKNSNYNKIRYHKTNTVGLMLRLILGTESRVRRFISGSIATDSQCGKSKYKSKNSIRIVWNDVTIFIHKQNKSK